MFALFDFSKLSINKMLTSKISSVEIQFNKIKFSHQKIKKKHGACVFKATVFWRENWKGFKRRLPCERLEDNGAETKCGHITHIVSSNIYLQSVPFE